MKYLKLYENFNTDDLEEILWILREIDNDVKLLVNELDGNLLIFKVDRGFSSKKLNEPLERLNVLDYRMLNYNAVENEMVIINTDYFKGIWSKNDIALKWLNAKFTNIKQITKENRIYLVDSNDNPLIYYFEEEKDMEIIDCYVNPDLIWNFIDRIGLQDYDMIQEVLNKFITNISNDDKKYMCYRSKSTKSFT